MAVNEFDKISVAICIKVSTYYHQTGALRTSVICGACNTNNNFKNVSSVSTILKLSGTLLPEIKYVESSNEPHYFCILFPSSSFYFCKNTFQRWSRQKLQENYNFPPERGFSWAQGLVDEEDVPQEVSWGQHICIEYALNSLDQNVQIYGFSGPLRLK